MEKRENDSGTVSVKTGDFDLKASAANDLFEHLRTLDGTSDSDEADAKLFERFGTCCAPVVFDSVGFTRISQERGVGFFLKRFIDVADIVGQVIKECGGCGFRIQADNLFAEFDSPKNALQASILANQAIAREQILVADKTPYQLCVGIGFGQLLRSNTQGVYGDEMNLACKLGEDIAKGDELLLTCAAHAELPSETQSKFQQLNTRHSKVEIPYFGAIWQELTN